MNITDITLIIAEAGLVFVLSTVAFDVLHVLLHRWVRSEWKILRWAAGLHQVHHRFLDKGMQVHRALIEDNYWAHLFPEFVSTVGGTLVFLPIFGAWPVAVCLVLHLVLFFLRCVEEGIDVNHMSMDRVDGRHGPLLVTADYHAMHHIHQDTAYSSFLGLVDMMLGTKISLRGKRVALSGANGVLGQSLKAELIALGAIVHPLQRDEKADFSETDILILASGSRKQAWAANYSIPVTLGDALINANFNRLVPPEIWGIGSESELIGFSSYASSKRAFANYAKANWAKSPHVTYRHIVPSAFSSPLGPGLLSAKFVARSIIGGACRGLRYIPVTITGLALMNFIRWAI